MLCIGSELLNDDVMNILYLA